MSEVHIRIQARKVEAESYDAAKSAAYDAISIQAMTNELLRNLLQADLGKYGEEVSDPWRYTFLRKCLVAKEMDGTYTVVLP